MKINIRTLPTYYINLDIQEERRQSTEYALNRLNFNSVTRVSGISYNDPKVGCARSQHKVLSNSSILTPFLLMEDDCVYTGVEDFESLHPRRGCHRNNEKIQRSGGHVA
jgi:hypothetical protein